MTTATERTPKVWIGCLAAYNEGTLHGKWFDVPDTEDELWAAIKTVIDSSPADYPEEWFFADNEDFHPWQPGEWPTIGKLVLAAQLIREQGAAAAGWLANDETPLNEADDYAELEESFQEAFAGTWDSDEAYAREYVESCGLPGVGFVYPEVPYSQERPSWSEALDQLDSVLDWESIARSVLEDVTVVVDENYDRHYFRAV